MTPNKLPADFLSFHPTPFWCPRWEPRTFSTIIMSLILSGVDSAGFVENPLKGVDTCFYWLELKEPHSFYSKNADFKIISKKLGKKKRPKITNKIFI